MKPLSPFLRPSPRTQIPPQSPVAASQGVPDPPTLSSSAASQSRMPLTLAPKPCLTGAHASTPPAPSPDKPTRSGQQPLAIPKRPFICPQTSGHFLSKCHQVSSSSLPRLAP